MAPKKSALTLSGEAWRDMTRIAHSPSELWAEISSLNRGEILKALRRFSSRVGELERAVEGNHFSSVKQFFESAQDNLNQ